MQCLHNTVRRHILLLAPSVTLLERLLHECECEYELNWLDMVINSKKSFCVRIGQRYDVKCASIISSSRQVIPWVTEIRYILAFILFSQGCSNVRWI